MVMMELLNLFEPIASDSSNSTDEDLSQDEERLHNTNWLVVNFPC